MKRPGKLQKHPLVQSGLKLPSLETLPYISSSKVTTSSSTNLKKQPNILQRGQPQEFNKQRLENSQTIVGLTPKTNLISKQSKVDISQVLNKKKESFQKIRQIEQPPSSIKQDQVINRERDDFPTDFLRPSQLHLLEQVEKRKSRIIGPSNYQSVPLRVEPHKKFSDKSKQEEVQQQQQPPRQLNRISLARSSLQTNSDVSFPSHDEYDIWDNQELQVRGINLAELDQINHTERVLKLYKIRYAQFPLQQESISNDTVVKQVKKIASSNKRVYRKYFKHGEPVKFEDEEDYSKPKEIIEDQNYKRFAEYSQLMMQPTKASRFKKQ